MNPDYDWLLASIYDLMVVIAYWSPGYPFPRQVRFGNMFDEKNVPETTLFSGWFLLSIYE